MLTIVLVAMVLPGPFMASGIAADKDRPFGELPPPGRRMEERPFGGPPPKNRGQEPPPETRYGKKCRTELKTCRLVKQRLVGAECTCPGSDTPQGAVIE
jgi:hypothetical protein